MRILNKSHDYNYPFPIVASSHWQRYPNPSNNNVISIDTFKREFDYENQRLISHRIVRYNMHAPRSLVPLLNYVGMDAVVTGIETSVLDLKRQRLSVSARNLSGLPLVRMVEECQYKGLKDGSTAYKYRISVDVRAFGFGSLLENRGMQMLKEQTAKSYKSLEEVCETVQQTALSDGIASEARKEARKVSRLRKRFRRLISQEVSFDGVGKSLGSFE